MPARFPCKPGRVRSPVLSLCVCGKLDGCDYFVSPQQEHNIGDLNWARSRIQVNIRGTSFRNHGMCRSVCASYVLHFNLRVLVCKDFSRGTHQLGEPERSLALFTLSRRCTVPSSPYIPRELCFIPHHAGANIKGFNARIDSDWTISNWPCSR